jgi:hypothetical protein
MTAEAAHCATAVNFSSTPATSFAVNAGTSTAFASVPSGPLEVPMATRALFLTLPQVILLWSQTWNQILTLPKSAKLLASSAGGFEQLRHAPHRAVLLPFMHQS